MFQLNQQEADLMVSQNVIPSLKHLGGYLPYAGMTGLALKASAVEIS